MADEHSLPLAPPAFANPLPPPSRSAAQTPLSNADFRKLLSTPRADRTPTRTPADGARGNGSSGGYTYAQGGSQRPEQKKPQRPKPKPPAGDAADADAEAGPTYRDRAAERREDANPDYEGMGSGAFPGAAGAGFALGGGGWGALEGGEDAAQGGLSVEESKFLGGDVAHTHLVKGLDFALLSKVRAEQQQRDTAAAREAAAAAAAATAAAAAPAVVRTSLARAVHAFLTGQRRANAAAAERFAHGRVAFVFDMQAHPADAASELPTTLLRADVADAPDVMSGAADGPLLTRLGDLMSGLRLGGGKKWRRKDGAFGAAAAPPEPAKRAEDVLGAAFVPKLTGVAAVCAAPAAVEPQAAPHAAAAPAAAAAAAAPPPPPPPPPPASALKPVDEDDDDIFGGIGSAYVCETTKKATAAASAAAVSAQAAFAAPLAPPPLRSYFGGPSAGEAEAPLLLPVRSGAAATVEAEPMQLPEGADAAAVYAAIDAAEAASAAAAAREAEARAAATAARLRKLQELEEDGGAYGADLYPGGAGFGLDLGGSDDEGGDKPELGKDGGAKKGKGKGKPGKEDSAAEAEKAREAKMGAQLADVRRKLAAAHGDKYEGAFAAGKEKRERKGGAEAADAEAPEGEARARAKRLRL